MLAPSCCWPLPSPKLDRIIILRWLHTACLSFPRCQPNLLPPIWCAVMVSRVHRPQAIVSCYFTKSCPVGHSKPRRDGPWLRRARDPVSSNKLCIKVTHIAFLPRTPLLQRTRTHLWYEEWQTKSLLVRQTTTPTFDVFFSTNTPSSPSFTSNPTNRCRPHA